MFEKKLTEQSKILLQIWKQNHAQGVPNRNFKKSTYTAFSLVKPDKMRQYSGGIFIARFGTSRRMPKSALEAQKSKVLQFQICSRTERKTLINQCQGMNQKSKFVRKSFFQNFCRKTLHGARKRAYMLTKLLLKNSRRGRVLQWSEKLSEWKVARCQKTRASLLLPSVYLCLVQQEKFKR